MNAKQFVDYAESIYRPSTKLISLAPASKLDWKPAHGIRTKPSKPYRISNDD
jgi:hypothetical protein